MTRTDPRLWTPLSREYRAGLQLMTTNAQTVA